MRSHHAGLLLALLASCASASEVEPHSTARPMLSDRALRSWEERGFVEMVPALMPATTPSGDERVTVWLRFPDNAMWSVRWSQLQQRSLPSYPVGTVVDRVDLLLQRGNWLVADVRGTVIFPSEQEFHVLRPDPSSSGRLVGFAWNRDDASGQHFATRGLMNLACATPQSDPAMLAKRNACTQCHALNKPAQSVERPDDTPVRPTDFAGLYQVMSVLRDESEVNDTRGHDVNVDDPHVRLHCATGTPSVIRRAGVVTAACFGSNDVPVARYDVEDALRTGEEHARAVCRSRRYLFDHADDDAKAAFADAFRECSL